uniref:Uncharacterized protein n=1 Tax=Candidatus Kentrum sp. LFY TaxID=2126342 RepID=A0A450U6R0_9GAMM|nr:MAG: hypothetical protein BECKLFY1418B_GA0070995_100637 [Candidatus Kentron sp. LFY]
MLCRFEHRLRECIYSPLIFASVCAVLENGDPGDSDTEIPCQDRRQEKTVQPDHRSERHPFDWITAPRPDRRPPGRPRGINHSTSA